MVLALFGGFSDVSSHIIPTYPIQPFASDALGGISTNKLGDSITANWTVTQSLQGERSSLPWIFSGPGFSLDLDKEIVDGTPVGTVWTNIDADCDGTVDYMAGACTFAGDPPVPTDPLKWFEATTAVEGDPNQVYLKAIMPPFSWLVRHTTDITHLCLSTSGSSVGTVSVLNTIYAAIPYSPNGSTFVAQTKLGGSPTSPPSSVCLDTPQSSVSVTTVYNNPPKEGDLDGVCNQGTQACADAGIYGMWATDLAGVPANTVTIASVPGSVTVDVEKYKVNNGPEAGVFEELWEVESTNADILAAWVPGGVLIAEDIPLPVAVSVEQDKVLSITCTVPGNYWGLVVLKNLLSPIPPTEDTNLDDNAFTFVVLVKCGAPATTPEVDKEVSLIRAVGKPETAGAQCINALDDDNDGTVNDGCAAVGAPETGAQCSNAIDDDVPPDGVANDGCPTVGGDHVAPAPGVPVPVAIDELKANHATTNVLGDEWLVAEVGDVDAEPGPDLILAWAPGVTVTALGKTTQTPAVTSCGTGCIKFQVNEWPGQADVNAVLNIACPATTPAGLYPVVVKAIDVPVGVFESKPSDNAQRKVITVRCGGAAPDGKVDGDGLYARWTILASQGSASLARFGDLRKSYTGEPSIPSDIGYVERIIDLQCFWIDADGCLTCDQNSDTIISETDSWTDDDMPAGIDTDGDCLAAPGLAQPGHPVDLPMNTGTCDKLQYSENPMGVTYSKEKDADCDGLVDGIEKAWGSNPKLADSDGDGAPDFVEMFQFTNPVNPDTDGDGFLDKPENNWIAASIPSLQCGNEWDDDGDGKVNDGCPPVDTAETAGALCNNNLDDDADTVINDGCIAVGTAEGSPTSGEKAEAANLDDNCPTVYNPDQLNSDGQRRDNGPSLSGIYASNPNQDKLGDACDDDNDNDGAINGYENLQGTNPLLLDTDGDTVNDGAELLVAGGAPLDSGVKPGWTSDQQVYYRGCRINVNALYTGFAGYAVTNGVEFDPDGDGSLCPTDKDSDNGTGTGSAGLIGISDKIESYGFGMSISSPDTDGDGCEDWIEVMDINGDRFVDSGDQGRMDLRVANPPLLPPDPVSDKVYDVNKDKFVDSGDQGSLNMNTCDFKNNIGGCPQCPAEN